MRYPKTNPFPCLIRFFGFSIFTVAIPGLLCTPAAHAADEPATLRERLKAEPFKIAWESYVDGNVHTQAIEGFWSLVKNGVRGTYHSVSKKWLQGYLNEYAWRYNHRDDREAMFRLLLQRATAS